MSKTSDEEWVQDIEGDFPLHKAIVKGTAITLHEKNNF